MGHLDISPNIGEEPGRLCKPLVNECQTGQHDCAREGGTCQDTPHSFLCLYVILEPGQEAFQFQGQLKRVQVVCP